MHNFTFHNPTKLIFGKGTITQIGKEIKQAGLKKALMIAGGGSIKKNGVYDQVTGSLKKNGIAFTEVWGVQPNPILTKVEEAIEAAKKEKVDCVLAVGGGSVIDTSKAVAGGYYLDNVWDAFENKATVKKALPLFTVLTLSATGSEMNSGAVITNTAKKIKTHTGGKVLYPWSTILDPSVQTSLPWEQTANGAIDALSHIMEFYFTGEHDETSLSVNEGLMKAIIEVTDELQENPKDYDLRANLAWACTLGLNGISAGTISYGDWASHMIKHGISAVHEEVAHGTGLGIVFPAWIKYVYDSKPSNAEVFLRWAKTVWNADSVDEGIQNMKSKLIQWKKPTSLSELGIAELDEIADVIAARGELGAVKTLDKNDVKAILELAK
ncbi:iron-containing alcohol dehydrogenase [Candidatus Woesearchaeota archaeon]|nr:iron-containing alcohol dehydrogenase [Candidatus Woesearchaeota archaeon]